MGLAALALGGYMLFFGVEEHDTEYLAAGGILMVAGALLRIEDSIRRSRATS